MKAWPNPILTVVVLLAAGVLTIFGTLAGVHSFDHSGGRMEQAVPSPAPMAADVWVESLSIVMAKYSCGSQSADVTSRVRELISQDKAVWANPGCLHADPHPYLNKALAIVYTVQGKPALLSVGENERVDRKRLLKHAQSEADPGVAQARSN